jgi:hypothetical protein
MAAAELADQRPVHLGAGLSAQPTFPASPLPYHVRRFPVEPRLAGAGRPQRGRDCHVPNDRGMAPAPTLARLLLWSPDQRDGAARAGRPLPAVAARLLQSPDQREGAAPGRKTAPGSRRSDRQLSLYALEPEASEPARDRQCASSRTLVGWSQRHRSPCAHARRPVYTSGWGGLPPSPAWR